MHTIALKNIAKYQNLNLWIMKISKSSTHVNDPVAKLISMRLI